MKDRTQTTLMVIITLALWAYIIRLAVEAI